MGSNISKLSGVASDLSTLELLIETNQPINVNFAVLQVQRCKDTIANILDLNIDIVMMIWKNL